MDDYKTTFGSMLDTMNREAARHSGIIDGQARDVLAAMLPAVSQRLAEPNQTGSESGFAKPPHWEPCWSRVHCMR